jgi:hypothetical protein
LDCEIPEERFGLPEYLTAGIRGAVEETEPSMAPLWLRFSAPVGILPVAPWERLLQPVLGVPILRLPYHAIMPPPATTHSLNTVVCFSSPKAKHPLSPNAIAEQFLRQVPADLAPYTAFHLFADEEVQPLLQGIQKEFGNQYDIRVYEPKEAPTAVSGQAPPNSPPIGRPLLNPWLIWMRNSLAGRSADLVHFLCHCYLNGEDGALALAKSPMQNPGTEASFVAAPELAEFLNQTGAWSIAFTSPPSNYSLVGMRMLQDQVARLRPGPCLLHDMVQPDASEGLGQAYRFLYVRGWQPPPNSSSISLYCHPYREMERIHADSASESLLNEYTLAGRLGDLLQSPDAPAWISTSQRVLEQNVSRFEADPVSDQEAAISAGQKNALRFVADVLAKHARGADNAEGGTKGSPK